MVLLPSGDQDNTFATYIRPNWPDMEYRQFSGGPNYGYGAQINATPENAPYLTADWMGDNVTGRGPLGELYRVWGDGKQMVPGDRVDYFGLADQSAAELKAQGYIVWMPIQPRGSWLGEGDNHTFMNMLGNGLRAYEHGTYGGWGGRSVQRESRNDPFSMSSGAGAEEMAASFGAGRAETEERPYPNFFPAAQRDFAARMAWSVTEDYAAANHPPRVSLQVPERLLARPGQSVPLYGEASDPDGDDVTLRWYVLATGSYPGTAEIADAGASPATLTIPADAVAGQTLHVILEATDDGAPALTRYRRIIIRVEE